MSVKGESRRGVNNRLNKIAWDRLIPACAIDTLVALVRIQIGEEVKVCGRRSKNRACHGLYGPILPFESANTKGFTSHRGEIICLIGVRFNRFALHFKVDAIQAKGTSAKSAPETTDTKLPKITSAVMAMTMATVRGTISAS